MANVCRVLKADGRIASLIYSTEAHTNKITERTKNKNRLAQKIRIEC